MTAQRSYRYYRKKLTMETEEEKAARKEKIRIRIKEYHRKIRLTETDKERQERLEKSSENYRKRIMRETEEERKNRLKFARKKSTAARNERKQRNKVQDQKEKEPQQMPTNSPYKTRSAVASSSHGKLGQSIALICIPLRHFCFSIFISFSRSKCDGSDRWPNVLPSTSRGSIGANRC